MFFVIRSDDRAKLFRIVHFLLQNAETQSQPTGAQRYGISTMRKCHVLAAAEVAFCARCLWVCVCASKRARVSNEL